MKKFLIILLIAMDLIVLTFAVYNITGPVPEKVEPINSAPLDSRQETQAELAKESIPEKETTFFFAGDAMFDRLVNHRFKDIGFDKIFQNIDPQLFADKDIGFLNLEGPISKDPIPDDYMPRSLVFNMPTKTVDALKAIEVNGVSLANNHTLNNGNNGFLTTQQLLKENNILYGGYQNGFDEGSVIKYDTQIPLSIVAVDYLAYRNLEKIGEKIRAEKNSGRFVAVYPHWGEEYSLTHSIGQRRAAESFVKAGADLIIGSHPHVVQDFEVIDNTPVFYSLGNFVFDQGFSKDTQEHLVLSGKIKEKELIIKLNPMYSKDIYLYNMTAEQSLKIIDRIRPKELELSSDFELEIDRP